MKEEEEEESLRNRTYILFFKEKGREEKERGMIEGGNEA